MRKTYGLKKRQFITQGKAAHPGKANQGILSLALGRLAFSYPQEGNVPGKLGPITLNTDLRRKTQSLQMSPIFLLVPSTLYTEHEVISYGIFLWSVGVSCASHVPPSSLCNSDSLLGWWVRSKKGFGKSFPAIMKTSQCYQHCLQQKSKTLAPHQLL